MGSPIVLVVDDGGFSFSSPQGDGFRVPFEAYERVLEVAEATDTVIPIAVTAAYLDTDGISAQGSLNPDADRIVSFLAGNHLRVPVWNHGLTHTHGPHATEFLVIGNPGLVSAEVQRERLELSQAILRRAGLGPPDVFVPPGHAWEPGVTDLCAAAAGLKAIAIREFEKKPLSEWLRTPWSPYRASWVASQHLYTLYRLGLGIASSNSGVGALDLFKARHFANPKSSLSRLLVHRSLRQPQHPHHHFAHVQNFSDPQSVDRWIRIVSELVRLREQ